MSVEARPPDPSGPPPDYCCAVLIDGGRYLLERRPADKADAPGRLTCFGGRREAEEDPGDCIRRELAEEIGFVPRLDPRPAHALYVDGRLIAWFWIGRLGPDDPAPTLEDGVECARLLPSELGHPDLSSWHAPILAACAP